MLQVNIIRGITILKTLADDYVSHTVLRALTIFEKMASWGTYTSI